MEESEKMVALKKAYAEIILNTAKDAAARVIVSERRALRVQHDLNATKEESLRMLLQLKQMLDSKTNEADIACISQRMKIEELEAQLGEAEDKILELRVELGNTTDELEKQKWNELQLQDASNDETPQNHLNNFDRIVPYSSDSDLETAIPSEKTDKGFPGATEESDQMGFSDLQKYYPHGSDIASIIMGSAEGELSRNGCTQRIRAFEIQQLGGTLSANQLKTKESERKRILPFPQAKNPTTARNMSRQAPVQLKVWTRQKRTARARKVRARERRAHEAERAAPGRSSYHQLVKCKAPSADSDSNLRVTENNAKSGEFVVSEVISRDNKMEVCSDSKYDGGILVGKTKRSMTRRKHCLSTSDEHFPNKVRTRSSRCLEPLLLSSNSMEDSISAKTDKATKDNGVVDVLLRYTFQRKRKKETTLNCPDDYTALEEIKVKTRAKETDEDLEESEKSSSINDSSRVSRRLAHISRQLISLSGKK